MAVTFDSSTYKPYVQAQSPSWAHTLAGGGSNLLAVVFAQWADVAEATLDTVTYGAQSMTRLASSRSTEATLHTEIFYLVAPSGNQTVTCNFSSTVTSTCGIVVVAGAAQTGTLFGTPTVLNSQTGGGSMSITVSSGTDEFSIAGVICNLATSGTTISATNTGVERWRDNGGSSPGTMVDATSTIAGSASAVHTWTESASDSWCASGVSIKVPSGATLMTADVQTFAETGVAAGLVHASIVTASQATFSLTGNAANLVTPQLLRPTSDIQTNSWTSTGANLFIVLDEDNPDDADYISSPANPTGQIAEIKFGAGVDPQVSTGHVVHYRLAATGQDAQITVALYCGATSIASWTHTLTAGAGPSTFEQTLSTGQADAITDYTDLRLRFSATA